MSQNPATPHPNDLVVDNTQRDRTGHWDRLVALVSATRFHALGQEERITGADILRSNSFTLIYKGLFTEQGVGRANERRFTRYRGAHGYRVATVLLSEHHDEWECIRQVRRMQTQYFSYPYENDTRDLTLAIGRPSPKVIIMNDRSKLVYRGNVIPAMTERQLGDWDEMSNHLVETGAQRRGDEEPHVAHLPTCCTIL